MYSTITGYVVVNGALHIHSKQIDPLKIKCMKFFKMYMIILGSS